MGTILGTLYGISDDREDEIKKVVTYMPFDMFLLELEKNKDLSIREKFYVIAKMTLETDQKIRMLKY